MGDLFQGNTFREYDEWLDLLRERKPRLGRLADALRYPEGVADVLGDESLTNREFVEVIALSRRTGYYTGSGSGNVAAKQDTDRQYSTNAWRFVEEFLQNADDCEYEGDPSVSIEIDERPGRNPTIEFSYNETGFTRRDIWAITAFSESAKVDELLRVCDQEGVFYREKTGRKGRGFKSVFALDAKNVIVHIRSNGFSFRLDNEIGCILPIWEGFGGDGMAGTRITVELIDARFGFDDIVSSFGHIFCVDDRAATFTRSPFLFMHRIRSISITKRDRLGCSECIVEYRPDDGLTKYGEPFEVDERKALLAGIRHEGRYRIDQVQGGVIEVYADEAFGQSPELPIPVIRYTRMVEDEDSYRNYSIMAPVLTAGGRAEFEEGSLFRTFPLPMHRIAMPVAIDAPFVLKLERDGIEYSPGEGAEGSAVPPNRWNASVAANLFEPKGVLESFLLALRQVEGVRMDRYIRRGAIPLFSDPRNQDAFGNAHVPKRDLSDLCHAVPVFTLHADHDEFVSYNVGRAVPRDMYSWPSSDAILNRLLRTGYEDRLVDVRYSDGGLIRREPIDNTRLPDALNSYLDALEADEGAQATLGFASAHLYPFLRDRTWANDESKRRCLERLRIFYGTVCVGDKTAVIRESPLDGGVWLHSDDGEPVNSINRYRVFESSPADLQVLDDIVRFLWERKTLGEYFSVEEISLRADVCGDWDEVRDLVEAAHHFGYGDALAGLRIPALERYSLSESHDSGFDAFRSSGVTSVVPDADVERIARQLGGDVAAAVELLKSLGIKRPDDYFLDAGNLLRFRDDTLTLLGGDECDEETVSHITQEATKRHKVVDSTMNELCCCTDETLLLLLREGESLLSKDSIANLCRGIHQERSLRGKDPTTSELRIRAYAGSGITTGWNTRIDVTLMQVLDHGLTDQVARLTSRKSRPVKIVIENAGLFGEIPEDEISMLLAVLGASKTGGGKRYYAGDLRGRGVNRPFLADRGGNVFLNMGEDGDYRRSLGSYLGGSAKLDESKLRYVDEMERGYQEVRKSLIGPALAASENDPESAFEAIEARFGSMDKRDVIAVISYFRYLGYAKAMGSGSRSSERGIANDYRRDPWRFVYEFIQNVDDCTFAEAVPKLSISADDKTNTLTFEYNEIGFSTEDIEALTAFDSSNKSGRLESMGTPEGVFDREKTGRKGRGFKSVFALPGDDIVVHVRSNGYSFKLSKRLGSVIPLWEDDETPESGTKITVEGFREGYLAQLEGRIRDMIGLGDPAHLFSRCPTLFLRKLASVSVGGDVGDYSIDIRTRSRKFPAESLPLSPYDIAGIAHDGSLRREMWEVAEVALSASGRTHTFLAGRYAMMFEMDHRSWVASALAPLMDSSTAVRFDSGSLFRTLPLDDHRLSIPIAINAPFETDPGRSGLAKGSSTNAKLVGKLLPELLRGLYDRLRDVDGIRVGRYVPRSSERPFPSHAELSEFDLRRLVRGLPILKAYGSEAYVSCEAAVTLPPECYGWRRPHVLCAHFGWDASRLVERSDATREVRIRQIDLLGGDFAQSLNRYLDSLALPDDEMRRLLREGVYPYVRAHYGELDRKYRAVRRQEDLARMRIFTFEMSDGTMARESAHDGAVWMVGAPDDARSFGAFRCLAHSSLDDLDDHREWYERLHDVVSYQEAFSAERMRDYAREARTWEQTETLIASVLYYHAPSARLPYLKNCVLSEELDPGENVFRDAYEQTRDERIAKRVISEEDLARIVREAGLEGRLSLHDAAARLRDMGVRNAADLFDDKGKGLLYLNTSARTMMSEYCTDARSTSQVLDAIDGALRQRRKRGDARLHVPYEDLRGCRPVVFATLFAGDILGNDTLSRIARDFCRARPSDTGDDYSEAYLRALEITGVAPERRDIHIALSEILARGIGRCVQRAKLQNAELLSLTIDVGDMARPYEVQAVDKALEWLGADVSTGSKDRFLTADLTDAFHGEGPEQRYLVDDSCVYLDEADAQGSLLNFVRDRYTGEDKSFGVLLDIITTQNMLKSWDGSKREFISELAKFRKSTRKQLRLLAPNYDEHIEMATGQPRDCVLPELLQNINDCEPLDGQDRRDLYVEVDPGNGTMLLRYDERGFDFANVYSITALGQSSKHDASEGEKGLGFKKVFSVFDDVEIYSNGFFFSLSRAANTVPRWIPANARPEGFDAVGKTTMIFRAAASRRSDVEAIAGQWRDLVEGRYDNSAVSPFFLHSISSIRMKGVDASYSRDDLLERYAFVSRPLFLSYAESLCECELDVANEVLATAYERLGSRKKLQGMSRDDADDYIVGITAELCLPKVMSDRTSGRGHVFSTLRTDQEIPVGMHLNVPLELSTGRNEVMGSSAYNATIFEMLLKPMYGKPSIFVGMLEELARENRGVFLADHLSIDPETLVTWMSEAGQADRTSTLRDLENAHLFRAYGADTMQSLRWGYTIPEIAWRYLSEVKGREDDLQEWMRENSPEAEHRQLLLPKTIGSQSRLLRLAETVVPKAAHHPLSSMDRDYAMEYLAKEFSMGGEGLLMGKKYDPDDRRDRFATGRLVPYVASLAQRVKDPEGLLRTFSSMQVLPFRAKDGTRLGCLAQPDLPWYFALGNDAVTSTTGYRIFDDGALRDDTCQQLRSLLADHNLAKDYSDSIVLQGLVREMAKERDYTPRWWDHALEALRIWRPKEHHIHLGTATANIQNNYFLFLDDHCPKELKSLLLRHGVFRDIRTQESCRHFWNMLSPREETVKAVDLLGEMGVPYTFVTKGRTRASQTRGSSDTINPNVVNFAMQVAAQTDFTGGLDPSQTERCELCHRLFIGSISKESPEAFREAVARREVAGGIPILNARGEYVPLSWDLFYFEEKQPKDRASTMTVLGIAGAPYDRHVEKPIPYVGDYERLLIDRKRYGGGFVGSLKSIHDLSAISKPFEEYSFGIRSDASEFYKWAWGHTKHPALMDLILRHYSKQADRGRAVPGGDVEFVLSVLDGDEAVDKGYRFDVVTDAKTAFEHADTANKIARGFIGVSLTVRDVEDANHFESYFSHRNVILNGLEADYQAKLRVEADPIWSHIYLTNAVEWGSTERYALVRREACGGRESVLLITRSDDPRAYTLSLAKYVQDTYGLSFEPHEEFDYSEEYRSLVAGVRRFYMVHGPKLPAGAMFSGSVNLRDIQSFEEECRCWQRLKDERSLYIQNEGQLTYNTGDFREYLAAKYHGVCQLCGGKTPKDAQDHYYWTYRVVKKRFNTLANLRFNLLCLCPTCHGKLSYGSYMGVDLRPIADKARQYACDIEEALGVGAIQTSCVMEEYADIPGKFEAYVNPIICSVTVNGEEWPMAFSWEHFMRIAFLFSGVSDMDMESRDEPEEEWLFGED